MIKKIGATLFVKTAILIIVSLSTSICSIDTTTCLSGKWFPNEASPQLCLKISGRNDSDSVLVQYFVETKNKRFDIDSFTVKHLFEHSVWANLGYPCTNKSNCLDKFYTSYWKNLTGSKIQWGLNEGIEIGLGFEKMETVIKSCDKKCNIEKSKEVIRLVLGGKERPFIIYKYPVNPRGLYVYSTSLKKYLKFNPYPE